MSGECKGWQDWDTFIEAGVVDNHIDFTDNKVVIDNVIGRTKKTIGDTFAIDAAVAYTLSKAGPDANLTVQDMVNEYTKTAAAMMNGKVGWGHPYLTGEFDGKTYDSCGHDEVELYVYSLYEPYLTGEGSEAYLTLKAGGWRTNTMGSFLSEHRAPKEVRELSKFRLLDVDNGVEHPSDELSMESVILSDLMTPLREWIENHFNCTKWSLTQQYLISDGQISGNVNSLATNSSRGMTRGKCARHAQYCTYHNANKYVSLVDWYMISKKNKPSEFMKIWNGSRCSGGWNSNMFESDGHWYHGRTLVRWSDVRRAVANSIDEAEVKRQIKKALNRMTKRNNHVVSITNGEMGDGAPEDRTYRWSDWSWLAVIQASVAQTSKKNRKENDIVNGWKYTKISSMESFGHEIAEFEWQSADNVSTYKLVVEPTGNSYYNSRNSLPFRFKTIEEAVKFSKMLPLIATKAGGSALTRRWDANAGKDAAIDMKKIVVKPINHGKNMTMEMSKDPEDLPSPAEIVQKVYWGLPNEYGPSVEHLLKGHELPKASIIKVEAEEVSA